MEDQVYIQRRYTAVDPYGTFNDAIVLLEADYKLLTQREIDDTKAARLASWKKSIDDAKLIPPPTKGELLTKVVSELAETIKKVDELTAEKAKLEAEIGGGK